MEKNLRKHIKNTKYCIEKFQDSSLTTYCNICQISYSKKANYNKHLLSKKHIRNQKNKNLSQRVSQLENLIIDNITNNYINSDIPTFNKEFLQEHGKDFRIDLSKGQKKAGVDIGRFIADITQIDIDDNQIRNLLCLDIKNKKFAYINNGKYTIDYGGLTIMPTTFKWIYNNQLRNRGKYLYDIMKKYDSDDRIRYMTVENNVHKGIEAVIDCLRGYTDSIIFQFCILTLSRKAYACKSQLQKWQQIIKKTPPIEDSSLLKHLFKSVCTREIIFDK
jgi:hypothetical protein